VSHARMVSAGDDHSVFLLEDGSIVTWGYNVTGQLGDGTTITKNTPVQVLGLGNIQAIAAGIEHGIAITHTGVIKTWGKNDEGQLGDNSILNRSSPVSPSTLSNIAVIGAGYKHSFGVDNEETWAWGFNSHGQLGHGYSGASEIEPWGNRISPDIKVIDGGFNHGIALKNDGTVWTWGDDT
jgi:alpha-tubulin suppressor-like RCC1 family protein